jgi:hypothetical protein
MSFRRWGARLTRARNLTPPLVLLIFAAGCGAPVTAPAEEPLAVPLAFLIEENAKNPAATAGKYAGRVVETEGYLASVRSGGGEVRLVIVPEKTASEYGSKALHVRFGAGPQTDETLARCDVRSRVRVTARLSPRPDERLESWGVTIGPAGE